MPGAGPGLEKGPGWWWLVGGEAAGLLSPLRGQRVVDQNTDQMTWF